MISKEDIEAAAEQIGSWNDTCPHKDAVATVDDGLVFISCAKCGITTFMSMSQYLELIESNEKENENGTTI